jgi:hypothetical protein
MWREFLEMKLQKDSRKTRTMFTLINEGNGPWKMTGILPKERTEMVCWCYCFFLHVEFVWFQVLLRGSVKRCVLLAFRTIVHRDVIFVLFTNQYCKTRSRDSDWLQARWPRVRSSSPGRVKNFLFSTSSRTGLGPPNLFSNGYREWSGRGVKLTTHLQLLPRSRKCGSVHPLSHAPSWRCA